MKEAFITALTDMAEKDPRVTLLVGDLGFGMIEKFQSRFPRQFLNVGIAEQNMIGIATGMALEGKVVFTYSIGNFGTLRCLEQIRNDALYHDANVKVVSMGGGFSYGPLGISHHATEDLSIFRALPGMTVVTPADDREAYHFTREIINQPGAFYLRLDKSAAKTDSAVDQELSLGRIRTIRQGNAFTFVSCGSILQEAIEAAEILSNQYGENVRVLSVNCLTRMDQAALTAAAHETGGIFTLEEHTVNGGLGSSIAEILLESGTIPRIFKRFGLKGGFASMVGTQDYLRAQYGISRSQLVEEYLKIAQLNCANFQPACKESSDVTGLQN